MNVLAEATRQAGIRSNLRQFLWLVFSTILVGMTVGLERTVVPLLGKDVYHVTSMTFIFAFIIAFGLTKAILNLVAGHFSDILGRRLVLIVGWLFGIPMVTLLPLESRFFSSFLVQSLFFISGSLRHLQGEEAFVTESAPQPAEWRTPPEGMSPTGCMCAHRISTSAFAVNPPMSRGVLSSALGIPSFYLSKGGGRRSFGSGSVRPYGVYICRLLRAPGCLSFLGSPAWVNAVRIPRRHRFSLSRYVFPP